MTLNGTDRNGDDPNGSSTPVDEACGLQAEAAGQTRGEG